MPSILSSEFNLSYPRTTTFVKRMGIFGRGTRLARTRYAALRTWLGVKTGLPGLTEAGYLSGVVLYASGWLVRASLTIREIGNRLLYGKERLLALSLYRIHLSL